MNFIRDFASKMTSEEMQEHALNVAGVTALASVCAYGGTFFFTSHNPMSGALYLGIVSLISHVAYLIFENMRGSVDAPKLKYALTAVQLLQIPMVFYFFSGAFSYQLTGASKFEIIIATAHFIAIPVFFDLGIKAWNEPTLPNIAAATGVMLSLVNGLRNYVRA